jgi:hypothetical protein
MSKGKPGDGDDGRLFFNFEHAGRLLRLNPEVLKLAALKGQINVVELGRRRLIPRAEIVRLSGGAIGDAK